ncbi:uncharacterized protein isoform X2 [Rhodnius prolixus]
MTGCIELGHYEAIRNGVPLRYRIQTITPDLIDQVMDLMVTYFLSREPLTSHDEYLEDPVALEEIKVLWRDTMKAGAALVALEDTDDGSINVIGANMTVVTKKEKDGKIEEYECEKFNKLIVALVELSENGKLYEKYNVDKYLTAYGLTVHPNYHGYQIGYRLLEARKPLCKSLGVEASGTVFTAQVSQHIAAKIGFETLSQQLYKTCLYKGQLAYPNLDGDMKFMGIKYT